MTAEVQTVDPRAEVQEINARLEALGLERQELPARRRDALSAGDSAEYQRLESRETQIRVEQRGLEVRKLEAQIAQLREEQASVAEKRVPLVERYREAETRHREAQAEMQQLQRQMAGLNPHDYEWNISQLERQLEVLRSRELEVGR